MPDQWDPTEDETAPANVIDAAYAAFRHRTTDSTLATLAFDSALDADITVSAHGEFTRVLSWEAPGVTVHVRVVPLGPDEGFAIRGSTEPDVTRAAAVRTPTESFEASVSHGGRRFDLQPVAHGPMRLDLVVESDTGPCRIHTDWVTL